MEKREQYRRERERSLREDDVIDREEQREIER
jgi:hypothetical protein